VKGIAAALGRSLYRDRRGGDGETAHLRHSGRRGRARRGLRRYELRL